MSLLQSNSTSVSIGFGTAALGSRGYETVRTALDLGFRVFDTAEESDYWYDQKSVGLALEDYFKTIRQICDSKTLSTDGLILLDKMDAEGKCTQNCRDLKIATKIPPWELKSPLHIRLRAEDSRSTLVGFCDDKNDGKFPLDVYYIHAPECWDGWHSRCTGVQNILSLRNAWLGMEGVVFDGNAKRIGLSNVHPWQLLDIINFVSERKANFNGDGIPPQYPSVVQAYADPFNPSKELHDICKKYGIEFVSYSTLGTQHHMRDGTNPVLGNAEINRMANKYNRSNAEVVLSWALQHGMSIIPRSTNPVHIKELANLLSGETFLDDIEMSIIDGLN